MKLTTHLTFNGQTEEAMTFYMELFGGRLTAPIARMRDMVPDLSEAEGNRVLYMGIEFDGQRLMANDTPDVPADLTQIERPFSLFLEVDSAQKGEVIFQALSQGGQVIHPLAKQAWGDHFGHVIDRFGIKWDIKIA